MELCQRVAIQFSTLPTAELTERKIIDIFWTISASFQLTQILILCLSTPFSPCKDESIIFLLPDIQSVPDIHIEYCLLKGISKMLILL